MEKKEWNTFLNSNFSAGIFYWFTTGKLVHALGIRVFFFPIDHFPVSRPVQDCLREVPIMHININILIIRAPACCCGRRPGESSLRRMLLLMLLLLL